MLGEHSFSAKAKFSEKLTFLTLCYAHVRVCEGVKNVSFSESFTYVLSEWSQDNHTSEANDNRLVSFPDIPRILPGTPMIVSLHFIKPS